MSVEETINNKKETGDNASQSPSATTSASAITTTSSSSATSAAAAAASEKGNHNVTDLETRCRLLEEEVATLKQSETTLKQQNVDAQRRERLLVRRLATKEQEMQDYMVSINF